MKLTYSTVLLASIIISPITIAAQMAETIFTNAKVYGHQSANAIAVSDGKIVFVGSSTQANQLQESSTEIVDLQGAFVLPGFIDNHNHVFEAASEAGGGCELSLDEGLDGQIPYLKKCRKHAKPNQWLMGYGFSIEAILNESNRYTPLQVIDQIFPEQPVILMEQTSHSMWVNSAALKIAGLTQLSVDPQGGKLLRDEESRELNGILMDNAGDIVMEMAWNSLENQFGESYNGLLLGLGEAAAHGITTIGDGRLYWKRGWYEVWKEAEKQGELTARISLRPWISPADPMEPQLTYLRQIATKDKNDLLLVDQVKMYSDGIFINGTAKTLAPYLDTYIPDQPYGINYIDPKNMSLWLKELNLLGYSAHIHAIGDGAVQESLNAIELIREQGSTMPYTLTHVELINAHDVPRFSALNVTADFQVGSDYVVNHDHQWAEAFLGAKRARAMMNLRSIYDTGANVTLSSDWNVHSINPLKGIANSIVMGKTGLPDVNTAIDAYTINAAYSLGLEKITGSIEIGKSADFAILEQDITAMKPADIADTSILMTVLQGKIVFDSEQ
ncbi:amidohydrolase [Vibrio makurazakiensis]|uniref:amidohydrolase n=1 Tax=Vibrio makurazakiensis TaxID=2910250 RepID=UPI003D0D9442